MTRSRTFLALVGAAAAFGGAALALPKGAQPAPAPKAALALVAATTDKPVLIELFTSQGCSSCPPADKLAETLSRQPGLVVISRPVTYWDRLGWKDTLARESNTSLQQDYARRGLAGYNGVYTPQMVVDGKFGAVGSQADNVAAGVKRYGGKSDASIRLGIRVGKRKDAGYTAVLTGAGKDPAELVLVAVTRHVDVVIGSGENGGRKIGYANVLRAERKLADVSGGMGRVAIAPGQLKVSGADRYALVLRKPDGGAVLAARWLF